MAGVMIGTIMSRLASGHTDYTELFGCGNLAIGLNKMWIISIR